jgi:hypothetical protein
LAELNLTVVKICADYFNGLLGMAEGKNRKKVRTENCNEKVKR